jgi:hypothetical protein
MWRILLVLILIFNSISTYSQSNATVFTLGFSAGTPINKSTTTPQSYFLKDVNTVLGMNIGVGYNINSSWQIKGLFGANSYNIPQKVIENFLLQQVSIKNSLNKTIAQNTSIDIAHISLEVKCLCSLKHLQIAPFLRSNIFTNIGGVSGFSILEKVPNEHYYKKTEWASVEAKEEFLLSPESFNAGVCFAKTVCKLLSIYTAVQYCHNQISFDVIKKQSDFNDSNFQEIVTIKHPYSYISTEVGLQITIDSKKRTVKM